MAIRTNPNQRVVVIGRKEPTDDKGNTYLKVNKKAAFAAMRNLRENSKATAAFDLWIWFASNAEGYATPTGPDCQCCNETGIKEKAYKSAMTALINLGYLVPVKEDSNKYVFHEVPVSPSEDCHDNLCPAVPSKAVQKASQRLSRKPPRGLPAVLSEAEKYNNNITEYNNNITPAPSTDSPAALADARDSSPSVEVAKQEQMIKETPIAWSKIACGGISISQLPDESKEKIDNNIWKVKMKGGWKLVDISK